MSTCSLARRECGNVRAATPAPLPSLLAAMLVPSCCTGRPRKALPRRHRYLYAHCSLPSRLSCTWLQVKENVEAVLQGLGLVPSPQAEAEAAGLEEVRRILAPVQGLTWPSGLPENN